MPASLKKYSLVKHISHSFTSSAANLGKRVLPRESEKELCSRAMLRPRCLKSGTQSNLNGSSSALRPSDKVCLAMFVILVNDLSQQFLCEGHAARTVASCLYRRRFSHLRALCSGMLLVCSELPQCRLAISHGRAISKGCAGRKNFLHVVGNILHNSSRKTSSRCDLPTEISELFWEAFGYWVCLLTFLIIEC